MSTNICSYQDCMVRRLPLSSIAFFGLPNDEQRRTIWIINSGNKELLHLKPEQKRFFCENHFDKNDIREQFNRKLLHRHAVLKPHKSVAADVENVKLKNMLKDALESIVIEDHDENIEFEYSNKSEAEYHVSSDTEHEIDRTEVIETLQIDDDLNPETEEDDDLLGHLLECNAEDEMDSSTEIEAIEFIESVDKAVEEFKSMESTHLNGAEEIIKTQDNTVSESAEKSLEPNPIDCSAISNMGSSTIQAVTNKLTTNILTAAAADYKSDEYFALSLVNYFQKLEPQTKALAKIKILSYLTALEFGRNTEL